MIRLDGNNLAAFRGAGVAGTVQSVAGCELFGAARSPKWAQWWLPYSRQAGEALKGAFSAAQWATIRDYGWEHPEIVGYMNAYAPEDAKIAYSLVEGIGERWCNTNGTFMSSGVFYDSNSIVDVTLDMQCTSGGWIGVNGILQYNCPVHSKRVKLRWVKNGGTCYIYQDGVQVSTASYSGYSGYFGIFRLGDGSGWNGSNPQGKIYGGVFNKNNALVKDFVPYVKNGVVGLLNLETGEFGTPSSGSFTISDSPA